MDLRARVIVALLMVGAMLLATPPAPADAGTGTAAADVAAKPRKAKKCKKGKVRVKINGRRLCRPARKALPKPKAGDPRLLMARSVFGRDLSDLRNRRGRKVPSLPKLVRKLGPRAPPPAGSRASTRWRCARPPPGAREREPPRGARTARRSGTPSPPTVATAPGPRSRPRSAPGARG
jgi:hypothetical protein